MSVHAHSSSYNGTGAATSNVGQKGSFLTTCMQAVCGSDPSVLAGRKYSTTMEDNSSITGHTHHNLNYEDECRITLSRFNKKVNGREVRFI